MAHAKWRLFLTLAYAILPTANIFAQEDDDGSLQADADYLFNEPSDVGTSDAFSSALSDLKSRIESLEEQNVRLEGQLQGREEFCSVDFDDEGRERSVEERVQADGEEKPKSYEELLKFTTETEERLKRLEEGIEKDKDAAKKKKEEDAKKAKKWFEKYTIRGYAQFRVNDVLENDGPARAHYVGDSSIGDNQSFLMRRARLILQGDVSEHLSLYFQPDFASISKGCSGDL